MARKRFQTTRYGPPNEAIAPGSLKNDRPAFGGDVTRSTTYYRAMAAETLPVHSQMIRGTPRPVLPTPRPPKDYTNTHGGVGRPRAPAPQRGGGTNTVHRKVLPMGWAAPKSAPKKPAPKAPPAGRRYQ